MEITEKQIKEEPTVINVYPIKKGRRVLLFLADFFICFIFSFILYNIATFPLAHTIMKYDDIEEKATEAKDNINLLLCDSELLYFQDVSSDYSDLNKGLSYTFELYIKDFLSDKIDHDVFYTYFVGIKNNKEQFLDGYKTFGANYFDIDVNNAKIALKSEYKTIFMPLLNNRDGLSDKGLEKYETMFNKYFLTFYSRIMNDLKVNGFVKNNISFIEEQAFIDAANKAFDKMVLISTFSSFFLGFVICYIIVPLINQYHKTIGMLMLRIQRIDIDSMRILTKKKCSLFSIYSVFTNLAFICFLPVITTGIEYIFHLSFALWLSLASFLIIFVSLIVLLIKQSNQSLVDFATRSAYISDDSLDEIFRARGYYI